MEPGDEFWSPVSASGRPSPFWDAFLRRRASVSVPGPRSPFSGGFYRLRPAVSDMGGFKRRRRVLNGEIRPWSETGLPSTSQGSGFRHKRPVSIVRLPSPIHGVCQAVRSPDGDNFVRGAIQGEKFVGIGSPFLGKRPPFLGKHPSPLGEALALLGQSPWRAPPFSGQGFPRFGPASLRRVAERVRPRPAAAAASKERLAAPGNPTRKPTGRRKYFAGRRRPAPVDRRAVTAKVPAPPGGAQPTLAGLGLPPVVIIFPPHRSCHILHRLPDLLTSRCLRLCSGPALEIHASVSQRQDSDYRIKGV